MPVTASTRRRPARPAALLGLAGAALLASALAPSAFAADPDVTIDFVSDTSWTAKDASGSVGPDLALPANAQHVCLNASAPVACPADATLYGWAGGGWAADLSTIPGAAWIWAPGIDGSTQGAEGDTYRFERTFNIAGTPVSGSLAIAADDDAELIVNGDGFMIGANQGSLTVLDLTPYLVPGDNVIAIRGQNGNNGGGPTVTYQGNPAGVAFGGSITYTPAADPGSGGSGGGGGTGGGTDSGDGGNPAPRVTMPPTDTFVAPAASAGPVNTAATLAGVLILLAAAGLGVITVVTRVARRR